MDGLCRLRRAQCGHVRAAARESAGLAERPGQSRSGDKLAAIPHLVELRRVAGAWQGPDGKAGTFATLWQRQKDGSYKWVLDHGETLASAPEQPEMVSTDIADCPPRAPDSMGGMAGRPAPAPPQRAKLPVADLLRGEAQDGTMRWEANVAGNVRQLHVYLKRNGAMQEILASTVTEPAQ